MKIYIVGAGPGAAGLLTCKAAEIITRSDVVVTSERLGNTLEKLNSNIVYKSFSETASYVLGIKDKYENICIMVSGDVCFFSASSIFREKLKGSDIECVSGISSMQYLAACLGIAYSDMISVSVHGRLKPIIAHIVYNKFVFVLTGGDRKVHDVIRELTAAGLTDVKITVGENLSSPVERIITGKPADLGDFVFDNLSVMLIENENPACKHSVIPDSEFIRGNVPMTKEAVRTLSVAALNIVPTDIVADIGAGTGSVTVELAKKAYEGLIYAVEREPEGISLIKQNVNKFRTYNVMAVQGEAPLVMQELPAFDKAFIGGSGGNLADIFDLLIYKNPKIRIVMNAVTLETLCEAVNVYKQNNMLFDVKCVNASVSAKMGSYTMMKAENPIYIISGEKNGK